MIPWRITFSTTLTADEAIGRIQAATDLNFNKWFPIAWRRKTESGHYYRFGGTVDRENHRFHLTTQPYVARRRRNPFTYVGRVETGMAETLVKVWVRAPLPAFLAPAIILALVWQDVSRVWSHPWNMDTTKSLALALVAIVALIGWSITEARYARDQLLEVLGTPPDPKDRIPL